MELITFKIASLSDLHAKTLQYEVGSKQTSLGVNSLDDECIRSLPPVSASHHLFSLRLLKFRKTSEFLSRS